MTKFYTHKMNGRLTHSTWATGTAFAAIIPTTTKPSGDGVLNMVMEGHGAHLFNQVRFVFLGTAANNNIYDYQLTGWLPNGDPEVAATVWTASIIAMGNVVLGNIDASAFTTDGFVADRVTVEAGIDAIDAVSPGDTGHADEPGQLVVDNHGWWFMKMDFDVDTATSANALWSGI